MDRKRKSWPTAKLTGDGPSGLPISSVARQSNLKVISHMEPHGNPKLQVHLPRPHIRKKGVMLLLGALFVVAVIAALHHISTVEVLQKSRTKVGGNGEVNCEWELRICSSSHTPFFKPKCRSSFPSLGRAQTSEFIEHRRVHCASGPFTRAQHWGA